MLTPILKMRESFQRSRQLLMSKLRFTNRNSRRFKMSRSKQSTDLFKRLKFQTQNLVKTTINLRTLDSS